MTTTARDSPLMMRLRRGKNIGSGGVPGTSSLTTAPSVSIVARQRRVLRRVDDVHARPEHRDGDAGAGQRAAMRRRIDAARQAADDDEAARGEIAGELRGHRRDRRETRRAIRQSRPTAR